MFEIGLHRGIAFVKDEEKRVFIRARHLED
jgi:hypothetical protein